MTEAEPALDLERQIRGLDPGDHLCVFYSRLEDQLATLLPFFKHGLEKGERCLYIADDRTVAELEDGFRGGGIDVDGESARGSLVLITSKEAYLRLGAFETEAMIAFWLEEQEKAFGDGFSGLRVTGETTWAISEATLRSQLLAYESHINNVLPARRIPTLCQYNRDLTPADTLVGVLRTHPKAILGDMVCPCPYYEPPEMLAGKVPAEEHLAWLVACVRMARERELRFESACERLKDLDKLKRDFLGVMSHELRTPLNAITGFGSLLRDGVAGPLNAEQTRYLDRLLGGADNLLCLVQDLIDVGAIAAGRFHLECRSVSLAPIVEEVVASVAGISGPPGRFMADVPGDLPRVRGDADRIRQVLSKLVGNAGKFSPPEASVRVRAVLEDGFVRCEIADQGPGFSDVERQMLFQPFSQIDMGSTRPHGGAGLGLSISRAIIEAHGGAIGVRSKPGAGATFWFTLPLA